MPKINKRLYGPAQLGATTATRYTVPALTRAVIRQITVINPEGGSSRTYTFGIGADAAATRIRDAKTIGVGCRARHLRAVHDGGGGDLRRPCERGYRARDGRGRRGADDRLMSHAASRSLPQEAAR